VTDPTPDVGVRASRKDETRKRLTDAALALIDRHDYDWTTAQVAEAAGCSQRTMFRYYDTKNALIFDALDLAPLDAEGQAPEPDVTKLRRLVAVGDQAFLGDVVAHVAGGDPEWLPLAGVHVGHLLVPAWGDSPTVSAMAAMAALNEAQALERAADLDPDEPWPDGLLEFMVAYQRADAACRKALQQGGAR
jgi:AcrR family transcriptional regulator